MLSIGSLLVKKFMPGERRSWKIFLLDISKQLVTSGFAHFLNLVLSIYLQKLTKSGNGCVWYFMNSTLDMFFATAMSYGMFKLIDWFAVKNNIEVLKQGVYVDEKVDLIDNAQSKKPEDNVNYRIWVLQVTIWVIIVTLSKIVVFFFEVVYYRPIVSFGEDAL